MNMLSLISFNYLLGSIAAQASVKSYSGEIITYIYYLNDASMFAIAQLTSENISRIFNFDAKTCVRNLYMNPHVRQFLAK